MATHSLPEGYKYTHVLIQPSENIFLPLEYEGTVKHVILSTVTKKHSSLPSGTNPNSFFSSPTGGISTSTVQGGGGMANHSLSTETMVINTIMRDYIKDLLEHGHGDAVRSIANPKYVLRPLVRDASFLDEFGLLDTMDNNNEEGTTTTVVENGILLTNGETVVGSTGLHANHHSSHHNLQKVIPLYTQSSSSSSRTSTKGSTADTLLPEIAYLFPTNTSSVQASPSVHIAEGKGVLKCSELSGGLILYEGEWRCGMRHGAGRGTIFVRSVPTMNTTTSGSSSTNNNVFLATIDNSVPSQAIFLGIYEGNWICGLRHGRGIFTEDAGCKYEGEWAFDIKHGQGIETSAGGGVYRGAWCRGQRHGCGTFIWPNGRSESREYEHGTIIAVRVNTNIVPNTPSLVPSELNINGTLSRIASGINLNIPPSTATVGTTNSSTTTTTLQLFRSAGIHPTPSMTNLQAAATAAAAAANAAAIAAKAQLQMNASLTTTLFPHTGVLENMDNNTVAPNNANLILAEALQNSIAAENNGSASTHLTTSTSNNSITGLSLDHSATSPTSSSAVLPSLVTTYGGIPFLHHPNIHLQFPVVTASGKPVSVSLNADVLRLLRHTSVGDLPAYRGKVVSVEKRDTVESCLTKMSDRNVLSVPVYDAEAGRYVAVLHMLDVFAFMLDLVAKKKATFSPSSGGLRETLAHQKRFALAPVSEVLAMARHLSPIAFRPLPAGTPLIYAAQILAEGGHAVPIVDSMTHRTYSITDSNLTGGANNNNNFNTSSPNNTPLATNSLPLSPHPSSAFLPLPTALNTASLQQRSTNSTGSTTETVAINLTTSSSFSSTFTPKPKFSGGGSTTESVTPTSAHTAPSSPASHSPSFTANAVSTATLASIPPITTSTSGSSSPVPPPSSSTVLSTNDNTPTAGPTSPRISVTPPSVPNNTTNNNNSDSTIPGNIVRMITQADIIRYVAAHLDQLGPLGTMTVAELGLGTTTTNANSSTGNETTGSNSSNGHDNNLVVARFTDRAFDVLQAMRARHAPAAPVVDQYGAMAANLSLSDVKTIARRANFSALNLSISQFFRAVDKGVESMNPSIYVRASTTFASLVLTLAATRIHQLYFVDEQLHPIGSVRIGDVLKILVDEGHPSII